MLGLGIRIASTPVPARANLALRRPAETTSGRKPQLQRFQVFPSYPTVSSPPCLTPAPQPDRQRSAGRLLRHFSRQIVLPGVASFILRYGSWYPCTGPPAPGSVSCASRAASPSASEAAGAGHPWRQRTGLDGPQVPAGLALAAFLYSFDGFT